MTAPTIVGAYAAMPRAIAERECLYRSLAETGWVDGIEIPYRDGLDANAPMARRSTARPVRPLRRDGHSGNHGSAGR